MRKILVLLLLNTVNSLTPDIINLTSRQASFISNRWLNNVVSDTLMNKLEKGLDLKENAIKLFDLDDSYLIKSINKLEEFIQENRSDNILYLCWSPKIKKSRPILSIIVAKIDKDILNIKHVVQSPSWDPNKIGSCKLRDALVSTTKEYDCQDINLESLYENDLRYKLDWSTWNLELYNDLKDE